MEDLQEEGCFSSWFKEALEESYLKHRIAEVRYLGEN